MSRVTATILVTLSLLVPVSILADEHGQPARRGADAVEAALGRLAESTSSIAGEWVVARRAVKRLDEKALEDSRRPYLAIKGMTLFHTWPGNDMPPRQAPQPAYYDYGLVGEQGLEQAALRHLAVFDRMGPILQAANEQIDGSWTYLTTADNWMLLFPFLEPDSAVNNGVPTEQVFYTAADFKTRGVGWTRPYLDLAGAGMMVTAASPAYDGNERLGVASQDITLRQISSSVLGELARERTIAILVDSSGLAIAASDPGLESEIERVSAETGMARLYYLDAAQLAALGDPAAVVSSETWLNALVTKVLHEAPGRQGAGEISTTIGGRSVSAARVKNVDWWLIVVPR